MTEYGRFQIHEIAATGAHGTVCLAWDAQREERVALKVLKDHATDNPEINRRHRDEARMLRHLRHPDIVRVHEMLLVEGRLVVVMEALAGINLDQLLHRLGTGFPPDVALEAIRRIAAALDAAWWTPAGPDGEPMRTVHRDVKPSNVLLTDSGGIKVVDFGIAKGQFADRETVTVARVMGSRAYMAPERLDGEDDTAKGDVYALGLSLFELLTGKPLVLTLHPGKQAAALDRNLGYLELPDLAPELVEEIRGIIRKMCAYEAEDRPDNGQVAGEVDALMTRAGMHPDLAAFAAATVVPELDARTRTPAPEHAEWSEVAFLEDVEEREITADLPPVPPCRRPDPDQLRTLVRAAEPRWKFWLTPPHRDQVLDALRALASCNDAALLRLARPLMSHDDPHISRAAREVLGLTGDS